MSYCRIRMSVFSLLTVFLSMLLIVRPALAAALVVTPAHPDNWQPADVRTDATVGITTAQPRGDAPNNLGSLEFTTNTMTNGQDKADYVKYWGVVAGRTLGNLNALSYEFYRASSSTTASHFVPAFRLAYATPGGKTGYLIWENVYNGAPVATDQWLSKDIFTGNFWMREFSPGATIQNYGVTLAEWQSNNDDNSGTITGQPGDPTPHTLGPDTNIIGIEIGVGSGWGGAFRGFVDNVAISFGSDSVSANFEPTPQCTIDCYVDDDTGSNLNGGTSFADAKRTIQAGVTQVSSGGTVHVKDGLYDEAVTIGKPLILEGIQHGVLAKGRPGPEAIIGLTTNQTPITVNASGVTIDGFTFDMSHEHTPWAITALNQPNYTNLKLRYNTFTGNPGTNDPNQDAGGAYLQNTTNTLIEGNFFDRLGSHAIFMAASSDGTIYRNNDSLRNSSSNFSAHVGPHTNTLVENNRAVEDSLIVFATDGITIKDNTYQATAANSSRVYLGGGDKHITIDNNTFTDMRAQAIQIFDAGFGYGANSDVTITDNHIPTDVANQLAAGGPWSLIDLRGVGGATKVDANRITLTGAFAVGATGIHGISVRGSGTGPTTIINNTLDGGSIASTSNPPSTGLLIRSNAPSYGQIAAGTTINANHNLINNFANGAAIYDFVTDGYGGLVTGVNLAINRNAILGNANGLRNATGANVVLVNGQCNWWGNLDGPSGAGSGSGDSVSTNVSFDPWLGSSNLNGACATPVVQFAVSASTVNESDGNAAIAVKLSEASGQIVTVHYATHDGTAIVGNDYTNALGTLTFNPGETDKVINVPITDDSLDEDDEALNLTLDNPSHATLGSSTSHGLTITDNDPPPIVQFISPNVGVNENAGAALIAVILNTPSSHEVKVNYSTSDGTALAGSDYTAISGQLIIPAGQVSTSFVVPIVNDSEVEPAETVNLQLATPTNATLGTANATLTVIDDDSGPLVNFSNAGYTVNEADGTATITVTLSAPVANSVTVGYTTGNGSASGGSDYVSTSGTLTFAPGVTNQTFTITISDDDVAENDETVALSLSAPSGATLGAPANASLTIVDNDTKPTVQFSSATYNVNENGDAATITVNLSQVATTATTVNYATSNGTATAGSDYTATSGTLTFNLGQISQTFTVPIIDDNTDESAELINLTLSNANNATLGTQATASLTIVDNEGEPIVEGQSANLLVAENVSGGLATVTVTLSAVATQTVSVSYTTSDVTALASNDYVATSGTLTFNPGQISRTFTVPILDDSLDEPNETVLIRYSTPANANLGAVRDVILTIVDNDLPPTVEFSRATYSVSENDETVLITATLSAPSAFTVRAPYLISNGSATAGSDYTVANGSLTFAPGQTSKSFAIAILPDLLPEGNETVNLALGTPTNASLGAQQNATLTIVDVVTIVEINARLYLPFISSVFQGK